MEFTISAGAARAKCKSFGGELTSFTVGGREYVWEGDPKHWSGQAPCLFPVVCRAKDDKITVDGRDYPMPKHGIVRKTEYTPAEVTADKVVFELRANEKTKESFPFDFILRITHTVREDGFTTAYTVINADSREMPFCIGGHPGFFCPLEDGASFEDYSLYFEDATGATDVNTRLPEGYMNPENPVLGLIHDNELPLRYSDYDNDAVVIEGLPKKSVKCLNRATGKGFRFDFDTFDALGIWTPTKMSSPFFCLEPWNGLPGSSAETSELAAKKYAKKLAAGESFTTAYRMTVID